MPNTEPVDTPKKGDVFVLLDGDHMGQRVEYLRTSGRNHVYRPVRDDSGASMGKAKAGSYKELRMSVESWPVRMARPAPANGRAGHAFRQHNAPNTVPVWDYPNYQPATGLIEQAQAQSNMSYEYVSPMQMQAWLDAGGPQRKVIPNVVREYSAVLQRDEWIPDAATPFVLDKEGHLMQGQHRALASVATGIGMWAWVLRGADPQAFKAMDTGRRRTIGDNLGINGVPSRDAIAAVVRNLIYYDTYGTFNPSDRASQALITTTTTIDYLENHPEVLDGYRISERVTRDGLRVSRGTMGACFVLFSRLSMVDAETFADYLVTGTNMDAGHPALVLDRRIRSTLTHGGFPQGRPGVEELAAIVIKAWNAYRKKRTVRMLKYSINEPFPTPV